MNLRDRFFFILGEIWGFITFPARLAMKMVDMSGQQLRAVFMMAMLGGMISNQFIAFIYLGMAQDAVDAAVVRNGVTTLVNTKASMPFFALIVEQLRFLSGLTAWFAIILGAIVIQADRLRIRSGENEISIGKGDEKS